MTEQKKMLKADPFSLGIKTNEQEWHGNTKWMKEL